MSCSRSHGSQAGGTAAPREESSVACIYGWYVNACNAALRPLSPSLHAHCAFYVPCEDFSLSVTEGVQQPAGVLEWRG
jgi:hypothetical protein